MTSLLELHRCTLQFGGLSAISDVSFTLNSGELVGLIGPNGAGKTTIFNLITGVYQPHSGTIHFKGHLCNGKRPYHITSQGIARTFQNIRLFQSMTVFENIQTAFHLSLRHGTWQSLIRGKAFFNQEKHIQSECWRLLEIFELTHFAKAASTSLSYGNQRRLEIARALATHPQLLLLDEPAAGMNATEKQTLAELIRFTQKEFQVAIFLVEHDMRVVMDLCDRILVMEHGRLIADDRPERIRQDPDVIRAYLGTTKR